MGLNPTRYSEGEPQWLPFALLEFPPTRYRQDFDSAETGGFHGAITQELHKAQRLAVREHMQAVDLYGGLGRNRTTDTRIFKISQ